MEFPYGNTHSRHQQHHRRDEREDDYPPTPARPDLPPPYYGDNERFPPPPQVYHSSHIGGEGPPPPFNPNYGFPPPPSQDFNTYPHSNSYPHRPPTQDFNNYSHSSSYPTPPPPTHNLNNYVYSDSGSYPPPPQTTVQHVSHESESDHHNYRPHMPSFVHHHSHHQGSELPNQKPAVRIFTKAKTDYSLTLRNGKVILAPSDPSDPFQHWFKDEKYSTKVKDEQGFPSFALINKATGEAIKHSIGATHPVQLAPYNPDVLDESILWTLSKDLGDGFRTIRMVNNIRLNVDAFNGDTNHGGVHDGTTIVLWEWKKGDNQRWSMVPY